MLVCDIITRIILPNDIDRSWFWKFRHILYKLEEYFSSKNINKEILMKIFIEYIYFQDFYRAESLLNKLD